MRFYFTVSNISAYAFSVQHPDGGVVDLLPELMDDGTYRVEIKTTDAKLMDEAYILIINNLTDSTSATITVNAICYVDKMIAGNISSAAALINLGKAMKLYCIAANEYNG